MVEFYVIGNIMKVNLNINMSVNSSDYQSVVNNAFIYSNLELTDGRIEG